MDAKYLDTMNKKLNDLKSEIVTHLMNENEEFNQLVQDLDPKDLVDIASDDIDRRTLDTLSGQDIKRLNLIDAALVRLKNGRYGVCTDCGKPISKERLEAIPYALKCIECQALSERHR
ncbi:MAG: TraR/DksA family transcriptional regulator [Spirochaetales bacterium]|nr:TraR/DksA family transcriptional regulator [Spirochaetales bacterium]